jgi:3D (Asp-Asp-Asp) domain-containing protein
VPLPVKKPKRTPLSSRAGQIHGPGPPPAGLGRRLTVTAYAYHLRGRTASGFPTRVGAVAVDPAVIPLGSRIWIPGYGWGRAEDTGGGIKGHKIDVWLPTASQCHQWGVRKLTIVVLDP